MARDDQLWFAVSLRFFDDPKMVAVSPEAQLIYLRGIAYSRQHMTDGHVPKQVVKSWLSRRYRRVISELTSSYLWVNSDFAGQESFLNESFTKWNPSRAEVAKVREQRRNRTQRHRESKRLSRVTADDSNGSVTVPEKRREEKSINPPNPPRGDEAEKAREVFEYWAAVMGKPQARFTPDRRKKISTRLKDGYTVDQLKRAVDGCRSSKYHMGDNPGGKKYNSIELIFRNGDKLESFMGMTEKPGSTHGLRADDLREGDLWS